MQAQHTHRPAFNYAPFYEECAIYPELPKFRRFAAQWSKKLYDDVEELFILEHELDDAIAEFRRNEGSDAIRVLNCPRSVIRKDDQLYQQWLEWERKLRTYTQDLCLSHQLFGLPDHAPWFSKHMMKFPNVFHDGDFGPTNERAAASAYQDPSARDFVAWKGVEDSDILLDVWTRGRRWFKDFFIHWGRKSFRRSKPTQHGSKPTDIEPRKISKLIDAFTCIFVPLLFTSTLYALVSINSLNSRIGVVGALGLAFSISAKIISGRLSRTEMFVLTAAFFAVASVFVSSTEGNDCSKS